MMALWMCGCTTAPRDWIHNGLKVGPEYGRPAAPVASAWIDDGNPRLKSETADYSYWWETWNDPVLNDLVRAAYDQNLSLRVAGMRVLEARAQLGIATGSLWPQQQQVTSQYNRSEFSENSFPFGELPLGKTTYDTWSLGWNAAWELDFWGRFRRSIEAADAELDAQVENYDDALVILQAEVAAAYIRLRTAEESLALTRTNVALQQNTLRITQQRQEAQVVSDLDVQQARSSVAVTASLIPSLEQAQRQAQNRLCILMGMPPQDLQVQLGGPGKIPPTVPEVAIGIPAELLRRRPDVRRAERQAAAQSARIGIAESDLYPHFSLTGNIRFEAENFSQLLDDESIAGSAGPGFSWDVLNYGRLRNNVRVQDARFQQLVLQYQQTVLQASEEAENAIAAYLFEQARVKELQESSDAIARATELATLQYEEGLIDFQRLLDSQRALVIQQDALANSRGTVALQLVALYKALGGGWRMRYLPNRPLAQDQAQLPAGEEAIPAEPVPTPRLLPTPERPGQT